MTRREVAFLVPAGIDDPARVSGGNVYDRHVRDGLVARGWRVWTVQVRDAADTEAALGELHHGATVLVDGLVGLWAAGAVVAATGRLRIVVLAHMVVGAFADATPATVSAERGVLAAAHRVIVTSRWSAAELGRRGLVAPERVTVAVPGADGDGVGVGGVDMGGVDMGGADVPGADVAGVDVGGVDVPGADVAGVDVGGVDVPGADVAGVDVGGVDVGGVDVAGVDVAGVDIGAVGIESGEEVAEGREFLCVGVVAPHKGQDTLLAALSRLPRRDWACTIAGSTETDRDFAASVNRDAQRFGGRVRLTGVLGGSELAAEYRRGAVLVAPSRVESYGMAIAEARGHGMPVVAASVGGIPDTVAGGGAILVPPDDPDALATALDEWLSDAGLRRRLRAEAQAAQAGLPTWVDTVTAVEGALERL